MLKQKRCRACGGFGHYRKTCRKNAPARARGGYRSRAKIVTIPPAPEQDDRLDGYHVALVDDQVLDFGVARTLAAAQARAEHEDGGPLEWDAPRFYDGLIALGHRGAWLIEQPILMPAKKPEKPRRPHPGLGPDHLFRSERLRHGSGLHLASTAR